MPFKQNKVTEEQIEKKYWAVMAENYNREQKETLRQHKLHAKQPKPAKIPKGSNHTRSSFAFARSSPKTVTDKVLPINLVGPVEFLPTGMSGCYDVVPQFKTTNVLEHVVIQKRGKRELMVARGFTACCKPGYYCQKDRCAKCWVLKQKAKKGWRYIVRETISGHDKPKVVDPYGVNPTGKRPPGKDMDPDSKARLRLTSSIFSYKSGAAAWR